MHAFTNSEYLNIFNFGVAQAEHFYISNTVGVDISFSFILLVYRHYSLLHAAQDRSDLVFLQDDTLTDAIPFGRRIRIAKVTKTNHGACTLMTSRVTVSPRLGSISVVGGFRF